jgi:hypothetical protein
MTPLLARGPRERSGKGPAEQRGSGLELWALDGLTSLLAYFIVRSERFPTPRETIREAGHF